MDDQEPPPPDRMFSGSGKKRSMADKLQRMLLIDTQMRTGLKLGAAIKSAVAVYEAGNLSKDRLTRCELRSQANTGRRSYYAWLPEIRAEYDLETMTRANFAEIGMSVLTVSVARGGQFDPSAAAPLLVPTGKRGRPRKKRKR